MARYPGHVLLDKSVRVVGPREAVLVCYTGPAIHCRGPASPRVEGVTIRGLSPDNSAVLITDGSRAVFENCDVSSGHVHGFDVEDASTEPVLRRNYVHGCKKYGFFFFDNAKGIVEVLYT
eukprot:tig00000269_g23686.t1